MFVCRERLKKTTLLHENEARTVNQAPLFVLPLREELPCLFIQGRVNMNDLNVWRGFEAVDESDDYRARNMERTGQQSDQFREDVIGRDELSPLLPPCTIESCRLYMLHLCGIDQVSSAGSISENISHEKCLPAL